MAKQSFHASPASDPGGHEPRRLGPSRLLGVHGLGGDGRPVDRERGILSLAAWRLPPTRSPRSASSTSFRSATVTSARRGRESGRDGDAPGGDRPDQRRAADPGFPAPHRRPHAMAEPAEFDTLAEHLKSSNAKQGVLRPRRARRLRRWREGVPGAPTAGPVG